MEHEELQRSWITFIKEHKLDVDTKAMQTRLKACSTQKAPPTLPEI
jgi:hypothetical protein